MKTSSFSNPRTFFSHPDREIKTHLEETWHYASMLLGDATMLRVSNNTLGVGSIPVQDLLKIIVFTHDMGKATSFFQSKIIATKNGTQWKGGREGTHAGISALFTLACTWLYIGGKMTGLDDAVACIVARDVVARHHGAFTRNISRGFKSMMEDAKKCGYWALQIKDLQDPPVLSYLESIYNQYLRPLGPLQPVPFYDVVSLVAEIVLHLVSGKESPRVKRIINEVSWYAQTLIKSPKTRTEQETRFSWFFAIKLVNSILLEADKMNAAFGELAMDITASSPTPVTITMRDAVTSFKNEKFTGKPSFMDELRSKMSTEVAKYVPRTISLPFESTSTQLTKSLSGAIYTLNAPTGSGKTLSSLEFAGDIIATIAQYPKMVARRPLRIIYSLPFLAIIDQVSDIVDTVLQLDNQQASSRELVIHHHLAPMAFKTLPNVDDDEDLKTDTTDIATKRTSYTGRAAELLIWSWNAEIVISTFHQLVAALYSNRNKDNLKFNKICQSFLILDEVQCIPIRYWSLIKETFTQFERVIGTPLLLMSATLPAIFPAEDVRPILSNPFADYFDKLDRITINVSISIKRVVNGLAAEINSSLKPSKSYLIVVNTRECARAFYECFEMLIGTDKEGTVLELEFLSSDVLASERRALIACLKERIDNLRKEPGKHSILLVSTQVVEAGVDLDFDFVYRDVAPLDSIIQVAGRCNRNFDTINRGTYTIVHLFQPCIDGSPGNDDYARLVYDPFMITTTEKILAGGVQEEKSWHTLAHQYYMAISQYFTKQISRELVDAITSLNFVKLNEDFSLIENESSINIFLSDGGASEKIWCDFKQLGMEKDPLKRKDAFLDLKARFESRVINVRVSRSKMKTIEAAVKSGIIEQHSDDLYYVAPVHFHLVYDKKGFHPPTL